MARKRPRGPPRRETRATCRKRKRFTRNSDHSESSGVKAGPPSVASPEKRSRHLQSADSNRYEQDYNEDDTGGFRIEGDNELGDAEMEDISDAEEETGVDDEEGICRL